MKKDAQMRFESYVQYKQNVGNSGKSHHVICIEVF